MNPPDPLTTHFDPVRLQEEATYANAIPLPSPPSSHPDFNLNITAVDIATVKAYLKRTAHSDAKGADSTTYSQLISIPNDRLALLFGRAFSNSDYRAIALESCTLKFASLLLHQKLCHVLSHANIIPPSQNGFRAGYRTNNNAFILRTLIDKSRSSGDSVYLAFVDISNAFPSTNQNSLWLRLEAYGLTG
ncbi:hypothetical protein F5051DRAFT_470385, partial [Lentinula edodes]